MDVPIAILAYFVYPLMTGIVGALIGIDKLGWRGAAAAAVAFLGLALIVGAQPGAVALSGVMFSFAAVTRAAMLLIIARCSGMPTIPTPPRCCANPNGEVQSHFSAPPFSTYELEERQGRAHRAAVDRHHRRPADAEPILRQLEVRRCQPED